MSIEIKNLLRIYGEQKAVNNISFKINKGEIVGFLGPNGAGKSTTMKIITGYLQQTSGEAFVCGINVNDEPLEIKKKIGYLPESNALYYDMYVREYLGFIAELHEVRSQKSEVGRIIELVGLSVESKKKIGQLSKGYKQRVGLAAALIHEPEVLILDEPTSGLDPNQIIEIREVIKKQGQNKTVLFSSHILQEVEAMCDRVIIINKGELVADDKLSNLQKAGEKQMNIKVEFKEAVPVDWLKDLENISSVKNIQQSTLPAGRQVFNIKCSNAELVKKQILQLSIEKNLNIISLQSEGQSLEDIFRSLTVATG